MQGSKKSSLDAVEILKPAKKDGQVLAWAPRRIIEEHTRFGPWEAKNGPLFWAIPGMEIKVEDQSGLSFIAPANGDPNTVIKDLVAAFKTLGLKTRVQKQRVSAA